MRSICSKEIDRVDTTPFWGGGDLSNNERSGKKGNIYERRQRMPAPDQDGYKRYKTCNFVCSFKDA